MGTPSSYTDDVADEIIERIANGTPLSVICREPGKPHRSVWYDWMASRPELEERFALARRDGYDVIAEDCLRIADDTSEHPASRKVRIWARLQLLAKWDPKRFGESLKLSGDPEAPLLGSLTDAQLDERIAAVMARVGT